MTSIKGYDFEMKGKLEKFEELGDEVEFSFKGRVTVRVPTTQTMCETLLGIGMRGLNDATIDFRTNRIELNKK